MLKKDFCWILESSNLSEKLPEFCERPKVGVRVVSPLGIESRSHPFTVPEGNDHELAHCLRFSGYFLR